MLTRIKRLASKFSQLLHARAEEKASDTANVNLSATPFQAINILRRLEDGLSRTPRSLARVIPTTSIFDLGLFTAKLLLSHSAEPTVDCIVSIASNGRIYSALQAKNEYYAHLSTPSNPHSQTIFDQNNLIIYINQNYPCIPLDEKGICYGLMLIWFHYTTKNKNLLQELNIILQSDALNLDQINLLNTIQKAQKSLGKNFELTDDQMMIQSSYYVNYPLQRDADFGKNIAIIVDEIVNLAKQNPGNLIEIVPNNEHRAHAIGVIMQDNVFKYFDSNYREASFRQEDDLKQSIINLVKYSYQNYFTTETYLERPVELPSISVSIYHLMPSKKAHPPQLFFTSSDEHKDEQKSILDSSLKIVNR